MKSGQTFYCDAYFHNDQGTLEDPTNTSSNVRFPDGTIHDTGALSKVNNETGRYGVAIDTMGFVAGRYEVAIKGTVTTSKDVGATFDFEIDNAGAGAGAKARVIKVVEEDDNITPIQDCQVWVTTDISGNDLVAGTLQTNSMGEVTFYLDPGVTYYVWRQKDKWNFTNPQGVVW